jgi:hypothetical protein
MAELKESFEAALSCGGEFTPGWSGAGGDNASAATAFSVEIALQDPDTLDERLPNRRAMQATDLRAAVALCFAIGCSMHKVALLGTHLRCELAACELEGICGTLLLATTIALSQASTLGNGSTVDILLWIINKVLGESAHSERSGGHVFAGWLFLNHLARLGAVRLKGERYIARLHNAATIFASIAHIKRYLQEKGPLNKSEAAILAALSDPVVLRMWCALAIPSFVIIAPLQLFVKKASSELKMFTAFQEARALLVKWTAQPELSFAGDGTDLFHDFVLDHRAQKQKRYGANKKRSPEIRWAAIKEFALGDAPALCVILRYSLSFAPHLIVTDVAHCAVFLCSPPPPTTC